MHYRESTPLFCMSFTYSTSGLDWFYIEYVLTSQRQRWVSNFMTIVIYYSAKYPSLWPVKLLRFHKIYGKDIIIVIARRSGIKSLIDVFNTSNLVHEYRTSLKRELYLFEHHTSWDKPWKQSCLWTSIDSFC